jgi:DNA-binding beta-propeller fold protein YncE
MKKYYFILLFACGLLPACMPDCGISPDSTRDFNKGTMLLCEGVFNSGNAEMTWYDADKNEAENSIFLKVNGAPLGDVLQSALKLDTELWLVVNNSSKILVLDAKTGEQMQKITGLPSPRYAAFANNKVYVTNLNYDTTAARLRSSEITVINKGLRAVARRIAAPWCEAIVHTFDDALWTGAIRFDKKNLNTHIYKIDVNRDEIVDSIAVGRNPYFMTCDKNGKLWVACQDYNYIQTPKLYQIDPITRQIEQTIDFTGATGAEFLCLDAAKENIFYVYKKDIYRKNCSDNTTIKLITGSFERPYGLGVNPKNGNIWVADAKDNFSTRGDAYIYGSDGVFIKKITTDIGVNGFVFY